MHANYTLGEDLALVVSKFLPGLYEIEAKTCLLLAKTSVILYTGVVASHTVPALYEKYEDEVDKYGKVAVDQANVQYKKIDALLLSKIPRAAPKDKKAQ